MILINSRKPIGKKLRRWLSSEVLPQIARTGNYIGNQETLPEADNKSILYTPELEVKAIDVFSSAADKFETKGHLKLAAIIRIRLSNILRTYATALCIVAIS
jgi:prophage antirepressor-like protein